MEGILFKKIDGTMVVVVEDDKENCLPTIVDGIAYPLHPDDVQENQQGTKVSFDLEQINGKNYAKLHPMFSLDDVKKAMWKAIQKSLNEDFSEEKFNRYLMPYLDLLLILGS